MEENILDSEIEQKILERIKNPGWVSTRGVLVDPTSQPGSDEYLRIQAVMRSLSDRGLVVLWRLILEADGSELLVAARQDLELDKDLERRGAWAKAVKY